MILAVHGILQLWKTPKKPLTAQITAGVLAETLMVLGYYIFEGFLYGFGAALSAIPFNAVQGVAGLALGLLLVRVLKTRRFEGLWDVFGKSI
jgi:uncharacterized membrane protein